MVELTQREIDVLRDGLQIAYQRGRLDDYTIDTRRHEANDLDWKLLGAK